MHKKSQTKRRINHRLLSLLLSLIMLTTLLPAIPATATGDYGNLAVEEPILLVSGDALIENSTYTSANISNEKSYTLQELQILAGISGEHFYSAINSSSTRRIYRSEGIDVAGLFSLSGYIDGGTIKAISADTYQATINLSEPRFYFPNIGLGAFANMNESNEAGSEPAQVILAWKTARNDKGVTAPADETLTAPAAGAMQNQALQLQVGQLTVKDVNNSLYSSNVNKLLAGNAITVKPISVLGKAYARSELMMMMRAQRDYTYSSQSGERTDRVRGVPIAELLKDLSNDAAIEFKSADNWSGISAYNMTKGELTAKNAILAYERYNSGWQGYCDGAGSEQGYFRLFVDGMTPAQRINDISVKSATASSYKHITHAGAPYDIDAITGATLTVEGPGVVNSVPVTVRQLEETTDSNIHRGTYKDLRDGIVTERSYEGIKVLSILDGLVNSNVITLDNKIEVVFKNRWRQEVSRLSYGACKDAATPVILAYGTAFSDGSAISPFVYNMGAGANPALGNEDGPLKLVYDQGASPTRQFSSIAYMYVEEGVPPPGFKHITATDDAYNNVNNIEFILTFTGDDLGREVNYTVSDLESMADANKALSHRDEYSLSNTTYWYVNEYEGIKLWDLLVNMGVDKEKADKGSAPGSVDNTPLVSFSSWDNYQISSMFSFYQLAHPELFYFYEKSPLDLGTDRPTKAQLATEEYQPDNQVGQWVKDSNNYPVKAGYPVLLAYGVNSYPYVRNMGMDGFKSGLGNDGGPMRLIYGKTDGLNRSNPNAEENYAYFFNNGSQQLQRVQEVYVGNGTRYSTHMENPAPAYQAMKDQPAALTVEITAGGSTKTSTFTLAELERVLYGQGVTKRDRDNEGRQEKGYYYYRDAGGSPIEDLFEGVNLEFLLAEVIGMQGSLGTVELYSGSSLTPSAVYDLSGIGSTGSNSIRGTAGLGSMVAFAKNGYPLVAGSNNSSNTTPGYVHDYPAGKAIRNGQGPLLFVRGQSAAERTAGKIETGVDNKTYVDNLTKIAVNLDPDPYAHVGAEYSALAGQQVKFSGAVAQTGGVSFTVGALETKQRYIVDGEYTIVGAGSVGGGAGGVGVGGSVGVGDGGGVGGGVGGATTAFYRGLDLYSLLYDKDIGASSLMNEITVKSQSGASVTLSYSDLAGSGKKVILAYGIGAGDNAKPLTIADGGPMRLIIDGGTETDCIINVSEIVVSAASITAWKHNFGVYTQYADNKLEVSGKNLAHNRTFTIAELEGMDNIIVQDTYKIGSNNIIVQGVELYKLLQNIGFAEGMDSSAFSVFASDGYSPGTFTASQLKDGINGKPIVVAFGQGTSINNGLPLVPNADSPGYDISADNQAGPLRLMIHDNSGWSVKFLQSIVVGQAGGNPDPSLLKDFTINGLLGGAKGYTVNELKSLPDTMGTNVGTYSYVSSGNTITDTVRGAYLYDLLKLNGVSDKATVTVNTTDSFENTTNGANYNNVSMSDISGMKYFVAYEAGADVGGLSAISDVRNGITATIRIYRNYDSPPTRMNRMTDIKSVTVTDYGFSLNPGGENGMPQASIRSAVVDSAGGIWAGSNGAGAVYISPAGAITRYTTDTTPALKTNFVTGIAIAPDGSVWLSQGGSVGSINAPPSAHYGFARFKDGSFTFYDSSSAGSTLISDCVYGIDVDKSGNVWLAAQHTLLGGGMQGGITKFNPVTNEWRTWTMADGLPTVSAWAVKSDNKGGAWVTTYQTSNVDLPWRDESYAYIGPDGVVKSFTIPAGKNFTWSRSIAITPSRGVYITRMSGAHDPANDGGWLDYIAPDGSVKSYKGDDLIPDLKNKAKLGFYPEIRTVFADDAGYLWLSTNGLGVYRCIISDSAGIESVENFSSLTGSWPAGAFDDVWSIYVSPDGKACFGSNGGIAWAFVDMTPVPQTPGMNKLSINYNSGTEKKLVITGPLVPLTAEKVYTESELKTFRNISPDIPDLYYVTSLNTVGTKRIYTVDGVSMFKMFDHAGLSVNVYRNADNFLFTVGGDGTVMKIGPGVITSGQGDITTPAGTLDEPRYTYPIPTYFNFNLATGDPDSVTDGQEIPWLLGFREDYVSVTSATVTPVAEPTGTSQYIRPYFGQRNIRTANNPLFNNATCRLLFSNSDMSLENARNQASVLVFDLFGVGYDRANILIGPRVSNNPIGEKVKGTFETDSGTVYFEGTSVKSLLAAATGTTAIKLTFADGSELTVPTAEIAADNYTLVYATGTAADKLSAVEHTVGTVKGYFDLYRDGAMPIENVTGIAAAGEYIPPVATPDSTDNYVNNSISITFASNAAYQAAITSLAITDPAQSTVTVPRAELTLSSTTITVPGSYFKTAGVYSVVISATGYSANIVAQVIGLQPPALTADSVNNTLTYGSGLDGTLNDIVITFDILATGWQGAVSAVKMGTSLAAALSAAPLDGSKYTVSAGQITIDKSVVVGTSATAKPTWYIVVEADGYAYVTVTQPLYWDTPAMAADITNNVAGQPIEIAFTPDNSNWRGAALQLKVEKDSALITAQSVTGLAKAANLLTVSDTRFGAAPAPGDYTLTFVYITAGYYRDVVLTQAILPALTADSTNNTLKNDDPIALTYSHYNDWFNVTGVEMNSPGAPSVFTAIPYGKWTAAADGVFIDNSVFTEAFSYSLIITTNKGTIEIVQPIETVPISSLRINAPPAVTVTRGGTYKFDVMLNKGAIDDGVVWSVNNPVYASVDVDGTVTILNKTGTVVLTASDSAGSLSHSIILRIT